MSSVLPMGRAPRGAPRRPSGPGPGPPASRRPAALPRGQAGGPEGAAAVKWIEGVRRLSHLRSRSLVVRQLPVGNRLSRLQRAALTESRPLLPSGPKSIRQPSD
jgi:hypothetical protein